MQDQQNHTPVQDPQPLVSFIIPCYQLPVQMLCECIDSVLALSLHTNEREIIVIDDGSEISPMNELMRYGDEILYIRQQNSGVSVARNTALQIAKGKYIQFLDGDDLLIQTPYEHCINLIRNKQDIDLLMFDFTRTRQNTTTIYSDSLPTTGSDYMRNHNIQGAIWCCLFMRSIAGSLRFTPGIHYGEDEEFTPLLLLRAEQVIVTNAQAYYYRERSSSAVHQTDDVSKKKRLDDTREVIMNLNRIVDRLPQNDRLALQRRIAQLSMDYLYNTIMLTKSGKILDERIEDLQRQGLFPLPDRNYSKKYRWFRSMTNTVAGRTLLLHTLPLLKKER